MNSAGAAAPKGLDPSSPVAPGAKEGAAAAVAAQGGDEEPLPLPFAAKKEPDAADADDGDA